MPATIIITGRLFRDPEMKTTSSGKEMAKLVIPVDSGFGDKKTTTWWTVTIWGRRASVAGQYLSKGSWVTVTGRPQVRQFEKRDGSKGFNPEVDADTWDFVGPKQSTRPPTYPDDAAVNRRPDAPRYDQGAAVQGMDDSDLPF